MSYIPLHSLDADRPRRHAQFPTETAFSALANARRRLLLRVLSTASSPLTTESLATRIAASEAATSVAEVTHEEHQAVAATLHHSHLPKLADLGIVERVDGETHLADDAPDFEAMGVFDLPDSAAETGADRVDTLFDALARDQRRTVVAVLAASGEELAVETLAEAVTGDDAPGPDVEFPPAGSTRMDVELYHRHLPKLADCGLVSWDREAGTVVFENHPLFALEWVDPVAARGPVAGGPSTEL